MLFNSFSFLVFFPIVCVVYFALPNLRLRNLFLLVASYYFYMNWKPIYALLLLSSTAITYVASLYIASTENKRRKKISLVVSLLLNLLVLFFYKYFNFAAESVTDLLYLLHIKIELPRLSVLLPVGISFYIFQALGYSIDVYRKDVKVEKNFFRYALFVSFFPQLVAGPIERSTHLLQQFYVKHKFDADKAMSGIGIMAWGYFMKLCIADRLAIYVNAVYNDLPQQSGPSILLASILFCFQLYGDFAGYSYIAIGASKVMGFDLMDNFRHPYLFSTSIQDYWKRNHISLTTWFMDYIYYPMVGSSVSKWWWCFSIFFTFFLSGFWHGAAWNYVVCFSVFGIYLVIELLLNKRRRRFEKKYKLKKSLTYLWFQRIVTFLLVCFALIFFRANNISDAFFAIKKIVLFNGSLFVDIKTMSYGFLALFILFGKEFLEEHYSSRVAKFRLDRLVLCDLSVSILVIIITILGVFNGGQFIYFQF